MVDTGGKYKRLSYFSLFVVTVYFILNSYLVLEWLNMQGILSAFADIVFLLDLFTWHIYGLFAIMSFIVKLFYRKKYESKSLNRNIFLHFIFMMVSFFEIYHMIQNAF